MKRRNPTLYAHGAHAARYHVLFPASGEPAADLYFSSLRVAKRVGRAIATATGKRVVLLSNAGLPKFLHEHYVKGTFEAGARGRNPKLDKRSLRTVRSGAARVIVGCPTGHYHPKRRGRRKCGVGTRASSILTRKGRRRNPISRAELERAAKTYRRWHQFEAHGVRRVRAGSRTIPRVLVFLGEVLEIAYRSNKFTGKVEEYVHGFKIPRPLLCTGPNGRGVYMIGGGYRVTARGLVG